MRDRQFATLLRHSPDATVIMDGAGLICEWNPAAELMLSRQRATVVGRPIGAFIPDEDRPQFDAAWAELAAGRVAPTTLTSWKRPDGSTVTATSHLAPIRAGGRFAGAVAIVREGRALDSRRAESSDAGATEPHLGALERDELTGLPGRRQLRRRLETPILPGLVRGVAVVDIDGFALVNEAYGPDTGDEALRDLAQRLGDATGQGYLGRWHADTFVWIIDEVDPVGALDELCVRVLASLDQPFVLGDDRLRLTVSTGLVTSSLAPDADLLAAATDALRAAKESGRDRAVWYLPAYRTTSTGEFRLVNDLHRGIENDELRLHFQPIIELATNAVVGVEALVRWERPGVGLLGPMSFIETAERSGLIVQLGAWVAQHACAAAAKLTRRADGPAKVSINLSARQLSDPGLVDMLRHALDVTGCAPSSVIVEVTETALTLDLDAAAATLETIKALGVDLDLDDFGTGYSSLLYLRNFPVDRIKIDRSFVAGLGSNFADTAIVFSTIALAHSIGIHAVAEGVETPEQLAALREMGCDFAQGFLISRPVELAALTAWLDERVPDQVESRISFGDGAAAAAATIRTRAANARDVLADTRDVLADTRDDIAAARERTADERDAVADEREHAGASAPPPTTESAGGAGDAGPDGATARRRARSGRVRASEDRGVEASERVQAEHRRDEARADRKSGASERVQAGRDRAAADTERNAPTQGRP